LIAVLQVVEISGGSNIGKTFIDKKFSMFGNKPAAALQENFLSILGISLRSAADS
jgi:hypothetical protein